MARAKKYGLSTTIGTEYLPPKLNLGEQDMTRTVGAVTHHRYGIMLDTDKLLYWENSNSPKEGAFFYHVGGNGRFLPDLLTLKCVVMQELADHGITVPDTTSGVSS